MVYAAITNDVGVLGLVWLSGLECCPMHQRAAGSIPGQGTYLVEACMGATDRCEKLINSSYNLLYDVSSIPSSLGIT